MTILFAKGLFGALVHTFLVIPVLGVGVAIVEMGVVLVHEMEWPVSFSPNSVLVARAPVPVHGTLKRVPYVAASAGRHPRRHDARVVRSFPIELGPRCSFGADAPVERHHVDAESFVDLRHLGDMPPRERRIAGLAHATEPFRDAVAQEQVSDQRFPCANAEFVREAEPWPNLQTPLADVLSNHVLSFRTCLQIV